MFSIWRNISVTMKFRITIIFYARRANLRNKKINIHHYQNKKFPRSNHINFQRSHKKGKIARTYSQHQRHLHIARINKTKFSDHTTENDLISPDKLSINWMGHLRKKKPPNRKPKTARRPGNALNSNTFSQTTLPKSCREPRTSILSPLSPLEASNFPSPWLAKSAPALWLLAAQARELSPRSTDKCERVACLGTVGLLVFGKLCEKYAFWIKRENNKNDNLNCGIVIFFRIDMWNRTMVNANFSAFFFHSLAEASPSSTMIWSNITDFVSNMSYSNSSEVVANASSVAGFVPPTLNKNALTVIIVYCILFVIAAIGNLTVFITLFRSRRRKSRISLMISHLAIADLLVTFVMIPLEVSVSDYFMCLFIYQNIDYIMRFSTTDKKLFMLLYYIRYFIK